MCISSRKYVSSYILLINLQFIVNYKRVPQNYITKNEKLQIFSICVYYVSIKRILCNKTIFLHFLETFWFISCSNNNPVCIYVPQKCTTNSKYIICSFFMFELYAHLSKILTFKFDISAFQQGNICSPTYP